MYPRWRHVSAEACSWPKCASKTGTGSENAGLDTPVIPGVSTWENDVQKF